MKTLLSSPAVVRSFSAEYVHSWLPLTAQTLGCGDTTAFHQVCFSRSFWQDLLINSVIFPTSLTAKCSCHLQEWRDLRRQRLA